MDAAQVAGHRAQVGAFHWRTGLRLEVSFDVMSYLRGELTLVPLKDLNANGCLIESPKRLEAGSIHQLRFTTSDGTTVTLIARTVDCRQPLFGPANRWHVGFTFPHAGNPAVRSQIVALLEDRAAAEST